MKRQVFIISDGTGITAETLGNSLISQFENIEFEKFIIPYTDTVIKAQAVVTRINQSFIDLNVKPLVFITLINLEIAKTIRRSKGSVFDLFNTFIGPLEQELEVKSSYTVGRTHGVVSSNSYFDRIEAVEYTLNHDDGVSTKGYDKADIILIGVSRSGKTPSCLYMALHFGILAANYPFTEEDLVNFQLPSCLQAYKNKLFGLTIDIQRLHQIRSKRRPNSNYASVVQCQQELSLVEKMYRQENIPYINSTRYSIEEIATKILATFGLERRL